MGCYFLLQCMKVKSESEVTQLCPTLSDPMDCSLPGPSIHGIFQARVLEWGAIAFSEVHSIHTQTCTCTYILLYEQSETDSCSKSLRLIRKKSCFPLLWSFFKNNANISLTSIYNETVWITLLYIFTMLLPITLLI